MEEIFELSSCTSIINEISREAVRELLEVAEAAPIEIVSTPRSGLTMMQVLDAFDSEFLLGEVLVSSAEVVLHGQRSFGMVTGDEPERSLASACAKVLLQGKDERLKIRVQKLLLREQAELLELRKREGQLLANTSCTEQ
jgi:phosphonate C-P lyase system protein PhnG